MFKKKLLTSSFLVISTLSCAKPYQSSDRSGGIPYETALDKLKILRNINKNIEEQTETNISIINTLLISNEEKVNILKIKEKFDKIKKKFDKIKSYNSKLSLPYDNMPKESNEDTKQRIIAGMPCLIIVMQQYSLVLKTEIVEVTQKNSFSFMQDSNLGNDLSTISNNNDILKSNMTQFETELQYLASKYPSNSSCNTPPTPSWHEEIADDEEITKDGYISTPSGHEEIADDEEITKDGYISTTIRPEDILFRSLLPLVNEIHGLLFNNLETFENLKDALISHQQNNTLYIITDLRKVIDFFKSYSYYRNSQNLILAREYNEAYLAMDIDGNNHNDCLNTMRNSLSELKKNLDKLMNDYDGIYQEVISNLKNELLNNPNINSETDIITTTNKLNAVLKELNDLLESNLLDSAL